MLIRDESGPASLGGGVDYSTLLAGGGGGGADYSTLLNGAATAVGGGAGSFLSAVATGAATGSAAGPWGAGIGAAIGGITALFSGNSKPVGHEKPDIQAIAARNGITEDEAGRVVAYQANTSSDRYDDLAKFLAGGGEGQDYFLRLVAKYNAANSTQQVFPGSANRAAQVAAEAQQKLITAAVQTPDFGSSAAGQQLVSALQAMPGNAAVGTKGETAGDILNQVLAGIFKGAVKGGSDAAATTDAGKSFKKSYIKDWLVDNQLLAGGIALALGFTAWKAYGPKGGKISL